MDKEAVNEDQLRFRRRARRRLIGAIVLVLVVVAAVPWLLPDSKPPRTNAQVAIRMPDQDASGYTPKVVPVAPVDPVGDAATAAPSKPSHDIPPAAADAEMPTHGRPDATAATPSASNELPAAQAPAVAIAKPSTVVKENSPKVAKREGPVESHKPKPSPDHLAKSDSSAMRTDAGAAHDSAKKAGTFYVQLGVFSNQDNAAQLQQKASARGVNVHAEALESSTGNKTRVRAGPFSSREEATKALERLKAASIAGVIVAR